MLYSLATVTFTVFGLILWYWNRSRRSIARLPGPPSSSWLVGNLPSYERLADAGEAHFEWTKTYGTAFRVKGCFGEDLLYLADPKALQYVFNKGRYGFPKTWEDRIRSSLIAGDGLLSVDGEKHARHRKIMTPSFSNSALKGYFSLFLELSGTTVGMWKREIHKQNAETCILDVSSLLSRTTLDIIGEAAFGYKFNSIEGVEPKSELQKAYQNLFVDVNFMAPDSAIAFRRILGYAPRWLSDRVIYLPKKDLQRLKSYMGTARSVAKTLVVKQMQAHARGKEGGKDVLSLFIKANNAGYPSSHLKEEEILSQTTTLLLAGHETTANTLGWTLYELAKHPVAQAKLRDEVRAMRLDIASRGESKLTISDLESMEYMNAVIKESLRYHTSLIHLPRRAGDDDVIPLDKPQRTVTGETITAIPVRKGQVIHLGVASYNRLKTVWGEDADEWRPERFLEELPQKTTLGVFGNLASFGSGMRSCIGWRFSVIVMQTVLTNLIDNFEFKPVPNVQIRRVALGLMQSMVRGEENKGIQLPLVVSIVSKPDAD